MPRSHTTPAAARRGNQRVSAPLRRSAPPTHTVVVDGETPTRADAAAGLARSGGCRGGLLRALSSVRSHLRGRLGPHTGANVLFRSHWVHVNDGEWGLEPCGASSACVQRGQRCERRRVGAAGNPTAHHGPSSIINTMRGASEKKQSAESAMRRQGRIRPEVHKSTICRTPRARACPAKSALVKRRRRARPSLGALVSRG